MLDKVMERFDELVPKEVGKDYEFGYKVLIKEKDGVEAIYIIVDWGNIKSFLKEEIIAAEKRGAERAIKAINEVWDGKS